MAELLTDEEKKAKQVITRIGKELSASKHCPNKGTIKKLLKEATDAFPDLKQSNSLKLAVKPMIDSLVRHGLLNHRDKDVRILVGICICEIIRVLAPDPDLGDAVYRDIFRFLESMFAELGVIECPYFPKRVKLLETVSKLQFCVYMLDTCEDLVLKMFKTFFTVVRDDHSQILIDSMSSIITCIMEEEIEADSRCHRGNTSQSLVDLILQNLIKERKVQGVVSASVRLAASVIEKCGEKLECTICQLITSCIFNGDAVESVVKEYYHEIILQIFQISPQMLVPVTPNLTHELLTDQVDVRIKALNLIRKLLALPGQNFAAEYRHIFVEFLNRFCDKSAEVRITALSCAKAFYTTNQPGRESLELISAIQGRLLDHDDKVRTEAVNLVCDLAKTNLRFASSDILSLAAERLRDKRVSVRSKALKKLVELYQDYCTNCAAGINLVNEHLEEIPCKILMLCYEKECQEFRPQSMELVLADLFPASLSIEERTKHWIFMFSIFKPTHLKALTVILSQKRRLQDGIQGYMDILNTSEEKGSKEAERKMEALVVKMSACFPDPAKARDCFQKLHELQDIRISSVLQHILNKENTLVSETSKDALLKELGDQHALSKFLHILSVKCSSNIFSDEHVHYILDCLTDNGTEKKHLKKYWVQLLLTILGAFPSLLRGSEKQFQLLLLEKEIPFTDQLIEVLAREGSHMSLKLSSNMYSSLEKICLEGTPVQSKLAISAIAALAGTSEQFRFQELCEVLVDSLCNGQQTPTVLQCLGCLAQHSISTFEAQKEVITNYIVEQIFHKHDVLCSKDQDNFDKTSKCCSSCELKVFGLKALVRSFLPHKHTSLGRPISFLLDIIQQMLQNGGFSDSNIPCDHNEACIRLAAAKAILRLSRKWDLHISPEIFRLTVLIAKDRSPWVRRAFVSKAHKFVKNHVIPRRYACAFLFSALDPLKDLRSDALKYLEEYIHESGKAAQMHETMTKEGAVDHPVFLIVFLIHVLAHDPDFPSPDCQNEKIYAHFMSPLFITLEALVKYNLVDGKRSYASSYLRYILNAIKRSEDAVDDQMTKKLHLLAEVGISILNSLNIKNAPGPHYTGPILLPSSLYKSGLAEMREPNDYHLIGHGANSSFIKALVSSLKTRQSGSNAQSNYAVDFLINETKEQSAEPHAGQKEQRETSHQKIYTGGLENQIASSHRGLINEFCAKNKHEGEGHAKLEEKLSSLNHCSSKNIVPTKNTQQQDLDGIQSLNKNEASANGQTTIQDAFGCQSKQEILPKNKDLCAIKVPQTVKRNKRSKDAIATSTSEVIDVNDNAIARRTRRQKLKLT